MPVEGIPLRDQIVTFAEQWGSYYEHESASFTVAEAEALDDANVASPPPTDPPLNTALPLVRQEGQLLNCTMGLWENEPTSYAYQWKMDGTTNVGSGASFYIVTAGDVGHTATCVLTATNAIGSTPATSNGVVCAASRETTK